MKPTMLILIGLLFLAACTTGQITFPQQVQISDFAIQQKDSGCARAGESAESHTQGCCRGLVLNQRGICSSIQRCSGQNEPAIYSCCPGLQEYDGFCLTESQIEGREMLGAAMRAGARGAASRLPSYEPPTCGNIGMPASAFENGCCGELVEGSDGTCQVERRACIQEGQVVGAGDRCCSRLSRRTTCERY